MPGAASSSASSSGGGGNGGGTKRKVSEPSHLTAGQSPGGASTPGGDAGGGSAVNGASGGAADGNGGGVVARATSSSVGDGPLKTAAVMKMKAEVFEKDRDKFLATFEKPTQIYRFLRARMVESPIFLQRNLSYMKSRMSRSHKARKGFKLDTLLQHKEECERGSGDSKLLVSRNSNPPKCSLGVFHCNGPVNFYNVVVMGVTDGQMWLPDTKARVDICIARVCFKKRKEGPGPVSKVFEKNVDIKLYSPSSPKSAHEIPICLPQKCPVVAIPAHLCSVGSNGHTVRSYKLVMRVTIPVKCLVQQNQQTNKSSDQQQTNNHLNSRNSYNNNNHSNSDSSLDEPKAKRRRSAPTTKDRENFIYDGDASKSGGGAPGGPAALAGAQDTLDDYVIYTGNISLYEKDLADESIREVDYDLQLKRVQRGIGNKISHQKIRREISWEPFDEKHTKVQEQAKPAGKCAKVCVAIRTSSTLPPNFVDPPPPLLSAIKKEEGAANDSSGSSGAGRDEMRKSVRVIYHFMYGNNSQQQTESRDDLRCPWCSLNCMQLYSLMKHLKLCHPRYQFIYAPIPNGAKIDVSINDSYDGSYSGSAYDLVTQPPGEAFARNGPTKRTEVFSILVCRPKACKQSLHEFFDCDEKDVDHRRTYITGHNRLYHHTSTCLPIHPREIDVDSEGEPDPEWLRVKTTMMIDEFTDVNEGEKELMKLWNLHVMKYNYVGDCQIPFACRRFVELHGKELIHKNLYRNFCLHLTNLFDFGLLTPQGVHTTIQLLHSQMRETSSASTSHHLLMNRGGGNGVGDSWSKSTNKTHANGVPAICDGTTITAFTSSTVTLDTVINPLKSFTTTSSGGGGGGTLLTPSTAKSSSIHTANLSGATSSTANNTATVTTGASNSNAPSSHSSNCSTGSTIMNGMGINRKLEVKDERSPNKKQTFFWLGGSYN